MEGGRRSRRARSGQVVAGIPDQYFHRFSSGGTSGSLFAPFSTTLYPSCSCANLPRRLRTFVFSLPPSRQSFFLSLSRCHPHCRPSPGHSVSFALETSFLFLLFVFLLRVPASDLPPRPSPRSFSLFPSGLCKFFRYLFSARYFAAPFLLRSSFASPTSLSYSCPPLYFSSSKRKYVESTLLDTICYVSTCGGVAHGNDTRAPFSARTEEPRTGRDR